MFEKPELLKYNARIGGFRSPENKPATLTGRGLFAFPEARMQPEPNHSKQNERRLMEEAMKRREAQSPEHKSPDWLARYWRQVAAS